MWLGQSRTYEDSRGGGREQDGDEDQEDCPWEGARSADQALSDEMRVQLEYLLSEARTILVCSAKVASKWRREVLGVLRAGRVNEKRTSPVRELRQVISEQAALLALTSECSVARAAVERC